jgi:hypothetical protein
MYQDTKTSDVDVLNRVTRLTVWWVEQPFPAGLGAGEYCAAEDRVSEFPGFAGPTRAVIVHSPDRLARGEAYRDFGMVEDDEAVRVIREMVAQAASRSAPCP